MLKLKKVSEMDSEIHTFCLNISFAIIISISGGENEGCSYRIIEWVVPGINQINTTYVLDSLESLQLRLFGRKE